MFTKLATYIEAARNNIVNHPSKTGISGGSLGSKLSRARGSVSGPKETLVGGLKGGALGTGLGAIGGVATRPIIPGNTVRGNIKRDTRLGGLSNEPWSVKDRMHLSTVSGKYNALQNKLRSTATPVDPKKALQLSNLRVAQMRRKTYLDRAANTQSRRSLGFQDVRRPSRQSAQRRAVQEDDIAV